MNNQNNFEEEQSKKLSKTTIKATIIRTVQQYQRDGHIDKWNREDSSGVDPPKYTQYFDKGTRPIQ